MQTKQTKVTNLYQNGNFVTAEMKKRLGQLVQLQLQKRSQREVLFNKENLPVS